MVGTGFPLGVAEEALDGSWVFEGPSLVTGRRTDGARFGGVSGCFSRVFDADDVVGRIMRARNPSSAGVPPGKLCLDDCFFRVEGGGPRDGLLLVLLIIEGLRFNVEAVVVARLGDRAIALCACNEFACWTLPDARLSDCLLADSGAAPAVLDPDEAVCAVKDAGSFTGLVGDLGFGLTNPVCGGEACIRVLGAEPDVVVGRVAGFEL